MIKGKRPILEWEVSTIEKSANTSVHRLVGSFDNAILMVGLSDGAVQFKAKLFFEQGVDKWILVELLVHDDIFVGKSRIDVTLEPVMEPGKGGSLADTSDTI